MDNKEKKNSSFAERAARRKMKGKMLVASLFRGRSRMLTTLLAVAVGCTILSGLLGIYLDVPRQLSQEFRNYGANLVLLPREGGKGIGFDAADSVRQLFGEGEIVGFAPYRYEKIKIHEQPFMLAATNLSEAKANSPYWLVEGSWPSSESEVLMGAEVASKLGVSIGEEVTLVRSEGDSQSMEGRDVVQRPYRITGTVMTGGKEEAMLFMSFEAASRLFKVDHCDVVEVSVVGNEARIESLSEKIHETFPALEARPAKRLTSSQDQVLGKLQALVWIVTVIVVLLTSITVTTTMLAVVTERRKEIGLKKALGASNRSIMSEFLSEGVLLGFAGGLLGILFGSFFAERVSISVFTRRISFHAELIPLTLVIALAVTTAACIIPVRKAAAVEPALVLRGE